MEPTDDLKEKLSRVAVILDDMLARGGEASVFARQLAATLMPGPEGAVDIEALFLAGKPLMLVTRGFDGREPVVVPAVIPRITSSVVDSGPGKALHLELDLLIHEKELIAAHVMKFGPLNKVQLVRAVDRAEAEAVRRDRLKFTYPRED
jgi:hypothetical protein